MPAIDSPCTNVCVLHRRQDICIGCGRTAAEIGSWLAMSAAQRTAVMALLPERLRTLTRRRPAPEGGR